MAARIMVAMTTMAGLAGCESKQAAFTEPMTLGGREVSAETLNQGRDLYRVHCVSCHGESGAGDGPAARSLAFPPRDFRAADFSFVEPGQLPTHDALVERIRQGVPERGMPMWKGMRDDDLSALADYIKTFSPRWQEARP
ncbi:MAG TPA: cytochrome c [Enhygromyxa sp.]|nr:cytochrome c [Enhygromyxa sp.]